MVKGMLGSASSFSYFFLKQQFNGSRYVNMDYGICKALGFMAGLSTVIVMYDIACQWFVNFHKRVKTTPTLHVPEKMSLTPAVGKFHLGAHIDSCFALFSLNFIQGAGQLDGEIIETLWSLLDKSASSTRVMSEAARQETIDKIMNDVNWRKTVGMGEITLHCHCIHLYADYNF